MKLRDGQIEASILVEGVVNPKIKIPEWWECSSNPAWWKSNSKNNPYTYLETRPEITFPDEFFIKLKWKEKIPPFKDQVGEYHLSYVGFQKLKSLLQKAVDDALNRKLILSFVFSNSFKSKIIKNQSWAGVEACYEEFYARIRKKIKNRIEICQEEIATLQNINNI